MQRKEKHNMLHCANVVKDIMTNVSEESLSVCDRHQITTASCGELRFQSPRETFKNNTNKSSRPIRRNEPGRNQDKTFPWRTGDTAAPHGAGRCGLFSELGDDFSIHWSTTAHHPHKSALALTHHPVSISNSNVQARRQRRPNFLHAKPDEVLFISSFALARRIISC